MRREFFSLEAADPPLRPVNGVVVCKAILERLRPHLERAEIDALSDYDRELPDEVRKVEQWLTELGHGRRRRGQDPQMGVELDLTVPEHWDALCAYGPWSINAELWGPDSTDMGTLHDSSYSVVVALTGEDVDVLGEALRGTGRFVSIRELDAERVADAEAERLARRARRAARLHALRRRLRFPR